MLFLFGRSLPQGFSSYFTQRAAQDGHAVIFASMGNFPSSEAFSELKDQIAGQPVAVIQSLAQVGSFSANDMFTQMLFAADTLKRYGAGPLWAVTPFGPYARQDQERPGKMDSVGCAAAARHLALDFAGISTIELHSTKAKALMEESFGSGNVYSVDPTQAYIDDINAQGGATDPVVVSPDKGANLRADLLAEKLPAGRAYVDKERSEVVHTRIVGAHGDVKGHNAIMIDDMADTLGTADNSARFLAKQGAASVFFYATHPVLSAPAWERLAKLIDEGVLKGARFGNTIARTAEHAQFAQQYGPDIADKVGFVGMEALMYDHLVNEVARHPAMRPAV